MSFLIFSLVRPDNFIQGLPKRGPYHRKPNAIEAIAESAIPNILTFYLNRFATMKSRKMTKIAVILLLLIGLLSGSYFFLKNRGMEQLVTNPKNLTGIVPALKPASKDQTGMNLQVE